MKFLIFTLVIVSFITPIVKGQAKRKLFYTKQWEITTKDSAYYYRICSLDTIAYKFDGDVTDFLMNDQVVMSGVYHSGLKDGIFKLYYPNGQIESEGEYKSNSRVGNWKYYFPDGRIKLDVSFKVKDFFVNSLYDDSGQVLVSNGNGNWLYEYEWYQVPFIFIVKGKFENGKKEGDWYCSTSDGTTLYQEIFSKNKLKKGILMESGRKTEYDQEYDNKLMAPYKHEITEKFMYKNYVFRTDYPFLTFLHNAKFPVAKSDTTGAVFAVVEEPAYPVGGLGAFYEYVRMNLRYPIEGKKKGIEGRVYVEFIINKDGSVTDAKVLKGIGKDFDEEAVRVVSESPNWNPGKQRGKPVKQKYVIPITFSLKQSLNGRIKRS